MALEDPRSKDTRGQRTSDGRTGAAGDRGGRGGSGAGNTALGAYRDTIKRAYEDPSRKYDTPENAKKARREMEKNKGVGPGTPGSIPNKPFADSLYGPTRLFENMFSPFGPIKAPMQEADMLPSATDTFGLDAGPQMGWSKSNRNEETRSAGGPDAAALEEERRKRRLAAQQTALGASPDSLLGPGVKPI